MTIESTLSARARAGFGAVGVAVLAAGVLAAVIGSTPNTSGSTYYEASFGRAGQGLDDRSDVKMRGITVGGVDSVRLDDAGRAVVRLRLDKGVRLPVTSTAGIEPVSVFGPKDVTIEPGKAEVTGPFLDDGATIAKTTDPEELADTAWPAYRLTSAIDPQDISTVLRVFSEGLGGRGEAMRRTVRNGGELVDLAHRNRGHIRSLLRDVQGLGATFENRGDTIAGLAADFNRLSPALGERPDKVGELLREVSGLGTRVSFTLDTYGAEIGALLDGGANVIRVLYRELKNLPLLLDGLNGFFGGISEVIRVEGPENSLLAQAVNPLPVNLCELFVDLCPPELSQLIGGRR